MKVGKTLYAKNRQEWRRWLVKQRIPYNDAVDEALCFGWIDSILKPIDARKYAQRYSPRKKTSRLSDMNRERVRRLVKAGRMTKAGLAAIAHTKTTSTLAKDVIAELKRDPKVWKNFQRFPGSYKRIRVGWIAAARHRKEVFEQRLKYFLKMTAQNKRFGMVQ